MAGHYDDKKKEWLRNRLLEAEHDRSAMALRIEKLNDALKAMIEEREIEKRAIEENLINLFKKSVLPYIEQIVAANVHRRDNADIVQILRRNLSFFLNRTGAYPDQIVRDLSPNEARILDLIRLGKQTKEIADVLGLAPSSVCWYRNQIRKKLGLTRSKTNLRSFLNNN